MCFFFSFCCSCYLSEGKKRSLQQNYTILYNILCVTLERFHFAIYLYSDLDKFHQIFNILCKAFSIPYCTWIDVYAFRCQFQIDFSLSPSPSFSIELRAIRVHAFRSHFTSRCHFYCTLIANILIL